MIAGILVPAHALTYMTITNVIATIPTTLASVNKMEIYIPVWLLWAIGIWLMGAVLNITLWAIFEVSRRELKHSWLEATITTLLAWPYSIICLPLVKYRRWKNEKDRQRLITEEVNKGEFSPEYARDVLNWKGQ